jgi:hypothetical protein
MSDGLTPDERGVLKKILTERKWLVPILTAVFIVVAPMVGVELNQDQILGIVALIFGSTVAEGAKDMIAKLSEVIERIGSMLSIAGILKEHDASKAEPPGEGEGGGG